MKSRPHLPLAALAWTLAATVALTGAGARADHHEAEEAQAELAESEAAVESASEVVSEAASEASAADATEDAAALADAASDEPPPENTVVTGEPRVAQAAFTSGIAEREPVDNITFLNNDKTRILFFTDLRNMQGQTVLHRWEHGASVVAEVAFEVRGPRWRVWSSKELSPDWLGEWRASVIDANGVVIGTRNFTYSDAGGPRNIAR